MRHAPQARFDRQALKKHMFGVLYGESVKQSYTLDQMERWTETDWNWHMREALRAQGFRTFHIREASETGVADLIVYGAGGNIVAGKYEDQVIRAWLELKIENDKRKYCADPRKAAQRQFMREHWREGRNAMYVMFDRKVGMLALHQGDLLGRVKMLPAYPYATNWQEVFSHFKIRKVSPQPQPQTSRQTTCRKKSESWRTA